MRRLPGGHRRRAIIRYGSRRTLVKFNELWKWTEQLPALVRGLADDWTWAEAVKFVRHWRKFDDDWTWTEEPRIDVELVRPNEQWRWTDEPGQVRYITIEESWTWTENQAWVHQPTVAIEESWTWTEDVVLTPSLAKAEENWTWRDVGTIIGASPWTTLAVNAITGAASTYDWTFDSYANIGDTHFAVDGTGLYTLGGADDAGSNITANARTGYRRFGAKARLESVLVSGATDGWLILKIRAIERGVVNEYWYNPIAMHALARGRIEMDEWLTDIGRGIIADYYAIEVENYLGDALELNGLIATPILLERRF